MKPIYKRCLGGIFIAGGGAWALSILYSAAIYFYADDRMLCLFPWLAKPVAIAQLVEQPDKFAGNWVRVQGELWMRTEKDAVLVPVGSGEEADYRGQSYHDLYRKKNLFPGRSAKFQIDELPRPHLYLHNFASKRIQSISALEAPRNVPVTILAEFEVKKENYPQHLDAVSMADPVQHKLRSGVYRNFFQQLVLGLIALTVFLVGLKLILPFRRKHK